MKDVMKQSKEYFPEYDPATYKMKIGVKDSGLYNNLPPVFHLTIIDSTGNQEGEDPTCKRVSSDCCCFQFQTTDKNVDVVLSC